MGRASASATPIPEHTQYRASSRDPTPVSLRQQLAADLLEGDASSYRGCVEGTPVPEDNIWEQIVDRTRSSMSPRPRKMFYARARSASSALKPRDDGGSGENARSGASPAINSARVAKSPASYSQLVYAAPRSNIGVNAHTHTSRGSTPLNSVRQEVQQSKLMLHEDLRAREAQLEHKERASNERIRTLESLVLALAQSAPGFQLEYIGGVKVASGGAGGRGSSRQALPRARSGSTASETLSIDRGGEGQVC